MPIQQTHFKFVSDDGTITREYIIEEVDTVVRGGADASMVPEGMQALTGTMSVKADGKEKPLGNAVVFTTETLVGSGPVDQPPNPTPTTVPPDAPASVSAIIGSNGDITVHANAPLFVGVPAYSFIAVGISGDANPQPIVTNNGTGTFIGMPPGVYRPYAYAYGNGGMGPIAYGSDATVAGAGVPPVITGAPAILGSVRYDAILTATLPGATGAQSSAIQWLRNGAPIAAAISNTYRLVAEDVGKSIAVRVTFTSADGAIASATSAATALVAPGVVTAIRMPSLLAFDGSVYVEATGIVGQQHTANAGDYAPYPGGVAEAHELWIDGIQVAVGTHGWTGNFWTPQVEDLGKTAVYIQRFTGNPALGDSAWPSLGVRVSSASTSLTSVTVANTSPAQGVMATMASIGGASAAAGTSATITARTDPSATGGIGVYEMTQAGLTAWQASDYTTAAANQVLASDIGAYAPGTIVQLGPFASNTVALVFKPIGSGTYSYTLGLGSGTTPPVVTSSALLFNSGDPLLLNSGDPIEVIAQ